MPVFANATGGATGSLTAFSGSTVLGQLNYTLTSLGPASTAVSFPTSLNFPAEAVGSSEYLTATLTNNSDADLTITSVTLNDLGDYEVQDQCATVLAARSSCVLSVSFRPLATGARTGTITLVDSASDSPQTLALSGTGTPEPIIAFSPSALSFPPQQVGTSVTKAVNLTNISTVPVVFSSTYLLQDGTDFVFKNACVASLPPGHSCSLFVTYTPTANGEDIAAIELGAITATGAGAIGVTGLATGAVPPTPELTLHPNSLAFASQQVGTSSAAQAVVLINGTFGSPPLNISSVSIVGAQANEFSLQNACAASLALGKSCALFVTFKPVAAGAATASISIVDNGVQQTVALTGTATAPSAPSARLNTTLLSFAGQTVGTASAEKAVVLTNSGTAALNIASATIAGPQAGNFSLRDACVASLPAGHDCALFVAFKPLAAGAISASLTIVDNATGSAQSVALTGMGQ